jgi:hypothetical protein
MPKKLEGMTAVIRGGTEGLSWLRQNNLRGANGLGETRARVSLNAVLRRVVGEASLATKGRRRAAR